jgi:hypothetical protein
VWNLIAVLALAVAAPANVTATKLDGTNVTGKLQSWTADGVEISTGKAKQSIPAADLLALQFGKGSTEDAGRPIVELVDGSVFPIASATLADKQWNVELRPAAGKAVATGIPLDAVRGIRWQPLDAEVLPQWQEIRGLALPSDLVVVLKRGGKSLDYLECTIGEVTADEVEFKLDGESMRVPRAKVAGVILFRGEAKAPTSASVVTGLDGLRIAAKSLAVREDMVIATTLSGFKVEWPVASVMNVDLSAGKVVFLSDTKPASADWKPLVGLPKEAKRATKFGDARFNQSGYGGRLALSVPGDTEVGTSDETKSYAKGLALRSHSELLYRLPEGYGRFLAIAGIDPAASSNGNVMLTIFCDDRLLTEAAISGRDAPLPIELDVAGVKRLRIVVDYGQNLDTGDWLNLCNARLVK